MQQLLGIQAVEINGGPDIKTATSLGPDRTLRSASVALVLEKHMKQCLPSSERELVFLKPRPRFGHFGEVRHRILKPMQPVRFVGFTNVPEIFASQVRSVAHFRKEPKPTPFEKDDRSSSYVRVAPPVVSAPPAERARKATAGNEKFASAEFSAGGRQGGGPRRGKRRGSTSGFGTGFAIMGCESGIPGSGRGIPVEASG